MCNYNQEKWHSSNVFRPECVTPPEEHDLANKSLRELQATGTSSEPKARLRLLCLSRGPGGILSLGRMFRRMDEDGIKQLTLKEFIMGLRRSGMEVTDDEAQDIFTEFETHASGGIDMSEFLAAIRPPMSESRVRVIEEAFGKMDKTGYDEISIEDLKNVYNVQNNTRYKSGEDSEEEISKKFLANFKQGATRDGYVTKEEFLDYYSAISAAIDNDCFFDLMMRQAYKL